MENIQDIQLYQELKNDGWTPIKYDGEDIGEFLWWYKKFTRKNYIITVDIGTRLSDDSYIFAITVYLVSNNLDKEFKFTPALLNTQNVNALNTIIDSLVTGVINLAISYLNLVNSLNIEEGNDDQG